MVLKMTNWLTNDIYSFTIALVLTGILIPQILLIAFRKQLFDTPDERKIHKGVVPRLGGIAFFPAILFSIIIVVGFNLKLGNGEVWEEMNRCIVPVYFTVCSTVLLFLVGMADDLIGVRYMAKFIVQILSALLILASGMYVNNLFGFLWLGELPLWFGGLFTIFCVVYVVNSINLIDGIDGLASGLSTVALIFYAILFYFNGQYVYSMLASASAGTLLPFFYYNVFGNANKHKKIFMGDTGSLTTGIILVFCSIAILHADKTVSEVKLNPVVMAMSPLIIPLFDVVRVYFHRVRRHRNPFLPDKCHIHHKLLAIGLDQRMALIVIMSWAAMFIIVNLALSPYLNPTMIILLDLLVWSSVNIGLTRKISAREAKTGQHLFD